MFLSYVLAAIQTLFPRTDFRTEAILETSQMPPAADLARHLLNDLHQTSDVPDVAARFEQSDVSGPYPAGEAEDRRGRSTKCSRSGKEVSRQYPLGDERLFW